MDGEARRAVVAALLRLADSDGYQDRADAGRAMAGFAELPEARQPLQQLLLDGADTFVTLVTAEALLRRHDPIGLAAVSEGLADADANHADWIYTAVHRVFAIYASERDTAVQTCDVLMRNCGPRLRQGVVQLRGILAEIDPLLRPSRES